MQTAAAPAAAAVAAAAAEGDATASSERSATMHVLGGKGIHEREDKGSREVRET